MMFIAVFLLSVYVLLLLLYRYGWWKQKNFNNTDNYKATTTISIIVAARNEAANIEHCVRSILAQNYPQHLWELIIVDDCSTDNTAEVVRGINASNLRLISLNDFLQKEEKIVSYKKKALSIGIEQCKGNLIVTTDADCWMSENWLSSIAEFYEKEQAEMIVAPVRFSSDNSLLELFQSLDFMTMQGITAAVVRLNLGVMCNGANLAFSRKAFDAVSGYEGVSHLISGDDYLLQLKIKNQFPSGIKYLKSAQAIVTTLPQASWYAFFQQRIRWASKTGKYKDNKMTFMLLLVYLFNCSVLFFALLSAFNPKWLGLLFTLFIAKVAMELVFLWPVSRFYGAAKQLFIFPLLQPLHIVYIIVAGLLSRMGKFEWKERISSQQ